tara:strand:- start:137 stop:250 length:114 start_codon:yes stop_codon:yes gene_type:complete
MLRSFYMALSNWNIEPQLASKKGNVGALWEVSQNGIS